MAEFTNADLFREIMKISNSQARTEVEVVSIGKLMKESRDSHEDLRKRVDKLEKNEARQNARLGLIGTGAGTAGGVGIGLLVPYLRAKLGF